MATSWAHVLFARRKRNDHIGKGHILATKWGLNPNSSSLGVDVTFLLLGATALSIATPVVSALVRLRFSRPKAIQTVSNAEELNRDPTAHQ